MEWLFSTQVFDKASQHIIQTITIISCCIYVEFMKLPHPVIVQWPLRPPCGYHLDSRARLSDDSAVFPPLWEGDRGCGKWDDTLLLTLLSTWPVCLILKTPPIDVLCFINYTQHLETSIIRITPFNPWLWVMGHLRLRHLNHSQKGITDRDFFFMWHCR